MTELRQRDPRQEDAKHLAYVRAQPCCIPYCNRPSEAAHLKMECRARGKESPGLGEKAHDKWTTPLCHYHHQSGTLAQHRVGEEVFWREIHGIDPFAIAEKLWVDSGGAERELTPKVARRPRALKARKPRGERTKITSNSSFAAGHRPFGGYTRPSHDSNRGDAQS